MAGRRKIVLMGPPGSGKGTQAEILAKELGIPAISTGEMLRGAVDEGSELGRKVDGIMRSGALVDDETMAEVVHERLARDDARRGFLLDGYPRTLGQAETLEGILSDLEEGLDAAVLVDVPEDELVVRALGRGRADDTEPVIRERLRVYREKTAPVIGFFEKRGLLRSVDGDASVEQVTGRIREAIRTATLTP